MRLMFVTPEDPWSLVTGYTMLTRRLIGILRRSHEVRVVKLDDSREAYRRIAGQGVYNSVSKRMAQLSSFAIGKPMLLARASVGRDVEVEVEIEDLSELEAVIEAGADIVLLDNMAPDVMRAAVERAAGRVMLEASGGITLASVRAVAESGVDLISVGALTHSATTNAGTL